MAIDTGLGTVLTAFPGSWTGGTISIDLGEETIPTIDISHLGTTSYRRVIAGDLKDAGHVTIVIQFDDSAALPNLGDSGTLTITDANYGTSGAIWGGSGIVTRVNRGSRSIDELKTAEVDIQWDGATGPTFTAST